MGLRSNAMPPGYRPIVPRSRSAAPDDSSMKTPRSPVPEMHVEIPVQLLVSVGESAAMDIDVHRQDVPTAQYRVMRQIQIKQVSAALPGFRIVTAIRQVGEVGDCIDVFRRAPAFERGVSMAIAPNRIPRMPGSRFSGTLRGRPWSPSTFRVPEHVLRQAIFRSELRADVLKSVILAVLSSTCVADARIDSSSMIPLSCDVPMRCSDSGEPGSDDGFRSTRKPVVCNGIYVDFIMIATRRKTHLLHRRTVRLK